MNKEARRQAKLAKYRRQKGMCHYCKRPITLEQATLDRLKPGAAGGTYHFTNIVVACHDCNNRKGDADEHSFRTGWWLARRKSLDQLRRKLAQKSPPAERGA